MSQPIRTITWGIVGTSNVAHQFASQLRKLPDTRLLHVAGSSSNKAAAFAKTHQVARHSAELASLCADPELDVVYIASPTRLHCEHALLALDAGKAVLCEKPLTTSPDQMQQLIDKASGLQRFCMEGMWMRFNPLIQLTRGLIHNQRLGRLVSIHADIGYKVDRARLQDPHRGPAWDYAVYALSLFHWLLGPPDSIQTHSDKQTPPATVAALLRWNSGDITATLRASIEAELPNQAVLTCENGSLTLDKDWFCPSLLRASVPVFPANRLAAPLSRLLNAVSPQRNLATRFQRCADPQTGFFHQAAEVNRCLRAGSIESEVMPLRDSLAVIHSAAALHACQPPALP